MEWCKLLNSGRRKDKEKNPELEPSVLSAGRQEIERDFDRLLFAAPTRRLADKTQVFPLDLNDSVRTRLTHSHEVANFARGIGMRLAFEMKEEIFGTHCDHLVLERDVPALLATIGLAHDLGNPPFGHQGEAAMAAWFSRNLEPVVKYDFDEESRSIFNDFMKFDGNSQTLRLVTRLQIINDNYGLNLTYASLAAMIKYPQSSYTQNKKWSKHGYLFSEEHVVHEIWEETGLTEGVRHPFTYLMEACDDVAYSILDAEDTIKKGLASYQDLISFLTNWRNGTDQTIQELVKRVQNKNQEWDYRKQDLSPAEINDMSMQMFRVHGTNVLITSIVEAFRQRHKELCQTDCSIKDLISISTGHELCSALKKFDKTRGYRHRTVLELELKGSNYIQGLMDMLWLGIKGRKSGGKSWDTPFGRYAYGRISENYRRVFEDPENDLPPLYKEAQLLADAISGMTDSYLIRLHDELKSLYEYESRIQPSTP
ncbi:dNTP triphosphohydrolase [Pantoea sp. LS15]|uniref:deoxyguanosinetriphosphate triphosphohydrolase family protein n=1 Tax=Enterobacterales TaxID=91347 RepID=UPI000E0E9461|nr:MULTISPECIES: dNTP triphosphohydrolase [Enterobacterales]NJQ21621.1 dNTP triphosphohydrolase [Pantoea sp. LS15]NKF48217.1 dNTP triphosphohydrolase [Pantoea sp. LS15]RDK13006.1 dNTP triphosphohydrolase [Enterobacter sp. 9-2]